MTRKSILKKLLVFKVKSAATSLVTVPEPSEHKPANAIRQGSLIVDKPLDRFTTEDGRRVAITSDPQAPQTFVSDLEQRHGASEAMALGWRVVDHLVPFLTVARQALSGLPFQGAVAGPLELLKTFQIYHANNEQLKRLPEQLKVLQTILEPIFTAPNSRQSFPKPLEQNCQMLSRALEETERKLDDFRHRGASNKFLQHAAIANALADATVQITDALRIFIATGTIQTQIEQHRQARENLHKYLLPAQNSSYDSKTEDGEPLICDEDTRTELLETISMWFENPNSKPFFWLSGLAGTGKSTVARTVAKHWKTNGVLGGSFFFSRWDYNLMSPFLVFPTLAYHLYVYEPSFLEHVGGSNTLYKLSKSQSLREQFDELILKPLLHSQHHHKTVGIVIDALDEGDEGVANIILHLARGTPQLPFLRILVTCRQEPSTFFRSGSLPPGSKTFQLHNIDPSTIQNDISRYLSLRLGRLRPQGVPEPWPVPEDLAVLVTKADKLFIYAATVVKIIGDSQLCNPQQQLRLLLSTEAELTSSPLDEMYLRVLRSALSRGDRFDERLVTRFKTVVGAIILLQGPLSIVSLEALLGMPDEVIPTLDKLRSVFIVPDERDIDKESIHVFHLSFPELLLKRCSPQDPFFIDEKVHHARLAELCVQCIRGIEDHPMDRFRDYPIPTHLQYACLYWADHLSHAPSNDHLLEAMDTFSSQYLLRWVELLHLMKSSSRITSSLMQTEEWASSVGGSETSLMLHNDAKWFVPAYLDNVALRLQDLGRDDEAMELWSSADEIYLETCEDSEKVRRHAVFLPDNGGALHLNTILSDRQQEVDEALKVFAHAAKMRGSLAVRGGAQHRFRLRWFFWRLSWRLYEMEHFETALHVAEEGVSIYRAMVNEHPEVHPEEPESKSDWVYRITHDAGNYFLHKLPAAYPSKNPDWFQERLCSLLTRVCNCCEKLARFERGLQANEELVRVGRSISTMTPDDLALWLNNLCYFCEKTGNFKKGLIVSEELVLACRALVQGQPDAFQKQLATSLRSLSFFCIKLDNLEKGLQATEEQVSMYRALSEEQPNVFRKELAWSLRRLCYIYAMTDNLEKGLHTSEELITIYRTLVVYQPEDFREGLAISLGNFGMFCSELGTPEKALQANREAVSICRSMTALKPNVFDDALAHSLNFLGCTLQKLGRIDDALEVAQESLNILRAITPATPEHQYNLSAVLDTVAVCLQKQGRHEEAQQLGHEAVDMSRQIFDKEPIVAHRRHLLEILENQIKPLESLQRMHEAHKLREEIGAIRQSHDKGAKLSVFELKPVRSGTQFSFEHVQ